MPNRAPIESEEYRKMISGEEFFLIFTPTLKNRYFSLDPTLVEGRLKAKRLCRTLNDTIGDPENLGAAVLTKVRSELLDSLFGNCDRTAVEVEPPFWCDYGFNISLGKGFYCNFNCCILGISNSMSIANARLCKSHYWR